MNHYTYILAALSIFALTSCSPAMNGDQAPDSKIKETREDLRELLASVPSGWKVEYFPSCDSLLFADPSKHVREQDFTLRPVGVGGFAFWMKFDNEGKVETLADLWKEETSTKPIISRYSVDYSTQTTLSFTTGTYLHLLSNDTYKGEYQWLYRGKDRLGRLVFGSRNSFLPAIMYARFTRLGSETDGKEIIVAASKNRKRYEEMKNPQLIIRQGDRVFYRSDLRMRYLLGDRRTLDNHID